MRASTTSSGPPVLEPEVAQEPGLFPLGLNRQTFEWLERQTAAGGRAPVLRHRDDLVLFGPEQVRHVMVTNHRNYVKGRVFKNVRLLTGNGLIAQDGRAWAQQRKMLQPLFHAQVVDAAAAVMERDARALADGWVLRGATGQRWDIVPDIASNILRSLLELIFGDDVESLRTEDGEHAFSMLASEGARTLAFASRFRDALRHVDRIVEERRRRASLPPDLLSLLMCSVDPTGEPMPLPRLRDEVAMLLVAGHETTAALIAWTWHLLGTHPEVEASMAAEVEGARRLDHPMAQDALPFTQAVLLEALRLHPPGWLLNRTAVDADICAGYRIPAGAELFIPFYFIHRDPAHFDEPAAFRPQRFARGGAERRYLENEPSGAAPSGPLSMFPFNIGPRRCIGDLMAMQNARIHFATVVPRLRLIPTEASVESAIGVNLRPARVEVTADVRRRVDDGGP